jgi:tRNA-splicing ligase RtcB
MKQVITVGKVPVKLWLDDIEEGAMAQAIDLSMLPFAYHHIAIMPDAHQGYGMPIGGVMATIGVVVPNAVGVDIGCGMRAVKTNLTDLSTEEKKILMGKIREVVPVGFNHHKEKREWSGFYSAPDVQIIREELDSAHHQLGTLGGGNHFIELQKGSDGFIWIMLHSGSRNFGLKIAKEYHEKAKTLCAQWYSALPTDELSFLPMDSAEGIEYLAAMSFATSFGIESRKRMLEDIAWVFSSVFSAVVFEEPIDVAHNYARMENHFGKNVMVHRKGAISARAGEIGIIPGSQGTKSYIVKGKGNPESFTSCSHGAGRKMSRTRAEKELSLEDEISLLNEKGIIHAIRNKHDLDEAPGAYKDIEEVIANEDDLVEIVTSLEPLAVIKG